MGADVHVVPAWEPHDTNGRRACDCNPCAQKPCPECDAVPSPTCWACAGSGLVALLYPDEPVVAVVVHNERGTV